jgi:hypothetical protein
MSDDPRVTKKRVTSVAYSTVLDGDGNPVVNKHEVVDYVREDFLDAYVDGQRAAGWQDVQVSEEYDAGPGGYDGGTYVPEHLDHELAGQFFEPNEVAE